MPDQSEFSFDGCPFQGSMPFDSNGIYRSVLNIEGQFIDKVMKDIIPEEIYKLAHSPCIEDKKVAADYLSKTGFELRICPKSRELWLKNKRIAVMTVEFTA